MTDLQLLPHEAERNPIVFAKDGEVFANSREIAAYFEKQHAHVLRDIDNLIKSEPKLGLSTFGETPFLEPSTGQTYRSFDMDETGFTLLGMGFTGQKALRWKLKYIEAFKMMRERLRLQAPLPQIDFSNPAVLLGAFQHLQSLVGEKDTVIAEQGDRLRKMDRLEAAGGSMCLTDAAKTLKVHPQELIRFLSSRGFIYKRVGNASWIGRQEKIAAGYLEHREHVYHDKEGNERIATRVLVTGKGLLRIAELLDEKVH
jgi:Rha family phage regulatory protein